MENLLGSGFGTSFGSSIVGPSLRRSFMNGNQMGEYYGHRTLAEFWDKPRGRGSLAGLGFLPGSEITSAMTDQQQQLIDASKESSGDDDSWSGYDYGQLFGGIGKFVEGIGTGAGSVLQAYYSKDAMMPGGALMPGSSQHLMANTAQLASNATYQQQQLSQERMALLEQQLAAQQQESEQQAIQAKLDQQRKELELAKAKAVTELEARKQEIRLAQEQMNQAFQGGSYQQVKYPLKGDEGKKLTEDMKKYLPWVIGGLAVVGAVMYVRPNR